MRVPNLGETDLLVPLHEGMFEQPLFQTFLDRLRRASGAGFAGLAIGRTGAGFGHETTSGVWPANPLGEWPTALQSRIESFRTGRVYTLSELLDGPGASEASLRAVVLRDGAELQSMLVLAGERAIGPDVANLMVALLPHLATALRVFSALEQERARSRMSADTLARMNFGWITLDAGGRILDCDPQAERMMQRSGELTRGAGGRLVPRSSAIERKLSGLVAGFAVDPHARPRAIPLSRDPWTDMLVVPIRSAESGAVAAVYLSGDGSTLAGRHEQLVELFGLTPSEARLAWSMAQGLTIAEAARAHRLTVETARNYSKKIYAKTGARGQVDLVRHILTGVLALA